MRGDSDRLERILAQIADPEDRAWLVAQLEPAWRRRRRRLDERDEQVRQLAIENFPGLTSSRIKRNIASMLTRYAAAGFRFERDGEPPADPTRRRLWTILQRNQGRPMSTSSIRDALAGVNRNQPRLLSGGSGKSNRPRQVERGRDGVPAYNREGGVETR